MPLEVVSSQSHTDLDRERARTLFVAALRALAGNLMRIVRGAGSGYLVPDQVAAYLEACQEFRAVHGSYPAQWDYNNALNADLAWKELRPTWLEVDFVHDDEGRKLAVERKIAEGQMRDGGLQVAASMLLKQIPQMSMGERELRDGFRRLIQIEGEQRAYWNSRSAKSSYEELLALAGKRPAKKSAKAKAKPKQRPKLV